VVTVDGSAVALVGTTTVFGLIALGGTQTRSVPGVLAAALLGLGAAAALWTTFARAIFDPQTPPK